MKRSRINPRNQTRVDLASARNYGLESARVRLMPCAVASSRCRGKIEVAHHPSRGASGGRFDIGPLCVWHHAEQGRGVLTFEASHGIDLRALWDEIALGHPRPLGLCGLARRWSDQRNVVIMVDELVPRPRAKHRCFRAGSCHLTANGSSPAHLAALHGLARRIGMKRAWFQPHALADHYDLTGSKRRAALEAGAVFVSAREQARTRIDRRGQPAELGDYEQGALVGWTRREVHRAPWASPAPQLFIDLDERGGEAVGELQADAAGWVAARLDVPLECAQALVELAA